MTAADRTDSSALRQEAETAAQTIIGSIRQTPVHRSDHLSGLAGTEVLLKLECLQRGGSFKLRGAANRMLAGSTAQRSRGVVAASTGNHGAAVARMAVGLGLDATIFVPHTAAPGKLARLQQLGVTVHRYGQDCVEAEVRAREHAAETGKLFLSPYNDRQVIAGQGTIALELEGQVARIDTILVPVGGGGLIAGIAGALKAHNPAVEVIGCQPQRSAVMLESVRSGRIVDLPSLPTLSDATAGGLEPGSITLPICRDLVDRWVVVDEEQIAAAMRLVIEQEGLLIEGAAALPVAALLAELERDRHCLQGRNVVLVLSGARIGLETLRQVIG